MYKHREFAMASGEMTKAQFTQFLETIFRNMAKVSLDGAIHFICMDWRHMEEVLVAGRAPYTELKNVCVWNKTNGGMGSFYRSKHELVFIFKVGRAPHVNTVQLGHSGRYRTNVWDYAGVNTFRSERLDELTMHPTVKPVALVSDAIKDCSRRGEIVLVCWLGHHSCSCGKVGQACADRRARSCLRRCLHTPLAALHKRAGTPCRDQSMLRRDRQGAGWAVELTSPGLRTSIEK
jgi:DNA methylase